MSKTPQRGHPLARRWHFICAVCNNPNDPNYQAYGGARGIENQFRDWDHFVDYVERKLGPIPFPGARLNRIDQLDHFRPGNLRWTDYKGQGNNQRRNYLITYKRKTKTLSEWADEYNINYHTAWNRYHKNWTTEQILGLAANPGHQKR
jgi:hypothetical protein